MVVCNRERVARFLFLILLIIPMTNHVFQTRYPTRAVRWQLRTRTLEFSQRPLLMGIVNVTPDSFSDGGRYFAVERAVEHALQLVNDGADLLDIGGESTRPYATPVSVAEELARVEPVLAALCEQVTVPISIDTSKAKVAQRALELGAEIINDVTGLAGDPEMVRVAITYGAGVCAMHMQGTPQTMQNNPHYADVVGEILHYLGERARKLQLPGLAPEKICLDPGIGFGKTHQHNLTLAAHCERFHELGFPLLVGHSRKGFIGKVLGNAEADRSAGTLGLSLALARQGVQVLRVHEIRSTREALTLFAAAGGIDGAELQLP
jgi:dihydropteroate synthase